MTGPPDDFYDALGVAKDATAAAIKLAYRKLVLKHHPDKVAEGDDKTAAADRFHKIQTAWETIGDEDKRSRYDAQCRLAALRREKELAERDRFATPDYNRPSAFRTATDLRSQPVPPSPRPQAQRSYSYRAVEVKPPYLDTDFDRYRPSDRRDFDFDHVRTRRTPPKDDRHRSKVTRQDLKETERARNREKGRQATKATHRDRDMKNSYARPEIVTDSDSDHYFERRSTRDIREEERARERHLEQARLQAEEARSTRYMDERTQRLFSDAQDYQQRMRSSRTQTENRRPSPSRIASSRSHAEYTKMADGRPAAVRRTSHKPRTTSHDDVDVMRSSRRGSERDVRRSSIDVDDAPRRPPPLNQTKSAPNEIRIPLEKQRANSVQYHSNIADDGMPPPPPVRRADSMPHAVSKERNKPVRSSTLRQAQVSEDYDRRRSPTRSYQYPNRSPKAYDDDEDDPVRGQYRTEVREPSGRRLTRSPSPLRGNESPRMSSSRQAPHHLPRTTSTTYAYPIQTGADILASRPKLSRTDSSGRKEPYLYGEIPTSRSSRDRDPPYSASYADNVRFREMRPDVKVATGYSASRRPSDGRSPSYYKQNSFNSAPVSA